MKGVTVNHFYTNLKDRLDLSLVSGKNGLRRRILVSEINRPGLILTGYSEYFARRRGQVLGKVEISYLRDIKPVARQASIRGLLSQKVPFCIVARNYVPPKEMVQEADNQAVALFRSPQLTIRVVNTCTI